MKDDPARGDLKSLDTGEKESMEEVMELELELAGWIASEPKLASPES